jgi:GTPase-activating protein BEM2
VQGLKSFGAFSLFSRRAQVLENEIGDDKRKMIGFWRDMAAKGGGTTVMAIKFQR